GWDCSRRWLRAARKVNPQLQDHANLRRCLPEATAGQTTTAAAERIQGWPGWRTGFAAAEAPRRPPTACGVGAPVRSSSDRPVSNSWQVAATRPSCRPDCVCGSPWLGLLAADAPSSYWVAGPAGNRRDYS